MMGLHSVEIVNYCAITERNIVEIKIKNKKIMRVQWFMAGETEKKIKMKENRNVTSGARYSGVPQKVFMVAASVMPSLQRPKSVILIWPSLSSIRFSNWKIQ